MKEREIIKEKFSTFIKDETLLKKVESQIYQDSVEYSKKNDIIVNISHKNFVDVYKTFSRYFYNILSPESITKQKDTLKLLESGKLNVEDLTEYYKISSHWDNYKEDLKIMKKSYSNFETEMATTTQFTCSKCRRNTKCCYTSVQTRSSDEPMTNFITCLECNHNWRE